MVTLIVKHLRVLSNLFNLNCSFDCIENSINDNNNNNNNKENDYDLLM